MTTFIFNMPQNQTTFIQALQYANNLTDVGYGGILGILILIIVSGALFLMMKAFGTERSFGVALIVNAILSVFLRILLLVNDYVITISLILGAFGIYLIIKEAALYEN